MIKFYPGVPGQPVYRRRAEPVEPTHTLPDDAPLLEREVFVERRQNPDRRNQRRDRGPFDMRGGRDRRKNQPGLPSIDLNV